MNKIDAIGIMSACLLVWIFTVFLVPLKIMVFVYMWISAWAVGKAIGNLPRRLAKETDRDFLHGMFKVAGNQQRILDEMMLQSNEMIAMIREQQAYIDSLMFEYCPEDMTPKQIANYEAHVRAVSQQQEDAIEQALKH